MIDILVLKSPVVFEPLNRKHEVACGALYLCKFEGKFVI